MSPLPARVLRLPPGHLHPLPDPARASADEVAHAVRVAAGSPVVAALLDSVDAALVVLNAERQIVASNGRLADALELRLGDALGCVNALGSAGGCGTSPACADCGALGAILASRDQASAIEAECLLRTDRESTPSLELNVRATPLSIEGVAFTVVSLRDISAEKRRDALEQVFLHDLLNTVAGLRGWAGRLGRPGADDARACKRIDHLSRQLEREIRDHRALVLAEQGALVAARVPVRMGELLADLDALFSSHPAARGRRLEILVAAPEAELETDPALLLRVVVNMVRNALEAVAEGAAVRVAGEQLPDSDAVRFTVHNEGAIPPMVQARIFQRSFSTKAESGRGLGTYGMKLLGERILGGKVGFESTSADGTVFWIDLPATVARSPRA